tara:strand:+ start:147 stop:299 length:153 start_codon:yes stop_codon:yes gene_type:complete
MVKEEHIQYRTTKEEKEKLRKYSDLKEMSMSEVIREEINKSINSLKSSVV